VQWTRSRWRGWSSRSGFAECADPFTIAEAHIPAGVYDFADLQLVWTMPSGAKLRTNVTFAQHLLRRTRTQVIADPRGTRRSISSWRVVSLTRLNFSRAARTTRFNRSAYACARAQHARFGNAFIQFNSRRNAST
jgi:hypothetical protein